MELFARLTKDAEVRNLKDGRKVVAFNVAVNDYYKTKSGEKREETTYFQCSYWLNEKAAERLKKGNLVALFGRVGINTWNGMDGEFHANLTFHVNSLKVVATSRIGTSADSTEITIGPNKDDLPF
jgi:single-strand DNA-binding protein